MRKVLFFVLLGLNLFLAYNLFPGQPGFRDYLHRRELRLDLQQELKQVQEQNKQLSKKIRFLQDDSLYLEKIVRSELHFVQEEEILYVVSDLEPEQEISY